MSHTYLLTLTPMSDFFFGGDYTFGADEERGEISRYRAVSRRFPSQSAVIGALRRALLIEAGCMTLHKKGEWVDSRGRGTDDPNYREAVRLAGTRPFSYTGDNDLGIFEELSPLFLYDGERFYTPDAPDRDFTPRLMDETVDLSPMHAGRGLFFEGYQAKEGLPEKLVDTEGDTHDYDRFFKKLSTVGIKKGRGGQTEEKAFFLKESWRLKKGSFALTVRTAEALPFKATQVFLGADRSMFLLRAEPCDAAPDFSRAFEPKPVARFVTLSETILSPEAARLCLAIVGRRVRQKQILSDGRYKERFRKSDPFYRYEPGTVLYTENPDALRELVALPELQKVGVNHFIEKTPTQGA